MDAQRIQEGAFHICQLLLWDYASVQTSLDLLCLQDRPLGSKHGLFNRIIIRLGDQTLVQRCLGRSKSLVAYCRHETRSPSMQWRLRSALLPQSAEP